jgi:ribonucleoside-diphosphate reductase alpha chain
MTECYPLALKSFIDKGIELELLGPQLADFDLDRLGAALLP